jgi:hypothetical protein
MANPNLGHAILGDLYERGVGANLINVRRAGVSGNPSDIVDQPAMIDRLVGMCNATPGLGLYWPNGVYRHNPFSFVNQTKVKGDGRWSTWLQPVGDVAGPVIAYNTHNPGGPVRNVYGSEIEGIGLDLSGAPSATGIYIGIDANWFVGRDIYIQGGAVGINNVGTNNRFEVFRIVDCGVFVHIDGDTGGELTLKDGDCTAYAVHCTAGIEMICATGGPNKGDLRIENVAVNSGGAALDRGLLMTSPSVTSMPLFATELVVDNALGGMRLVNIADVRMELSWVNAAAGTTSAIEIAGGYNHGYETSTYFGGAGAGGSTYEFTGAGVLNGFESGGNKCPTGPVYRVTGARPIDHYLDDICPGAVDPAQITNDVPWLSTGAARRWGHQRIQGEISRRESGTKPWAGYATLPGGTPNFKVVANTQVTAGTRVKLSRERYGGTAGHLSCSVADHAVGTSFTVFSDSATDTGSFYWEMYDPD